MYKVQRKMEENGKIEYKDVRVGFRTVFGALFYIITRKKIYSDEKLVIFSYKR